MRAILLLAMLAASSDMPPPLRHRAHRPAAAYVSFCNQLASGDKAGNWGCFNGGDLSGSGFAWTGIASPTLTAGNATCAGAGYATLNGTTQFIKSASVPALSGDFTVCMLYGAANLTLAGMWAFVNNAGSAYGMTTESQGTTTMKAFLHSGLNTFENTLSPTKELACMTYKASDGTTTVYTAGTLNSVLGTFTPFTDPGTDRRWVIGSDGLGSYFLTGRVFGGFATEKVLSLADYQRINAAVTCH